MKISAIIVTLNEEYYLPTLLNSLNNQIRKFEEILVIDAGSEDRTQEIANEAKVKLEIWHPPVGAQRQKGGETTNGDLLFFFDADVILPKDYVEKMVSKFNTEKVDIACPNYVPIPGTKSEIVTFKIINFLFWFTQKITPSGGGMGIVVKKSLFEKVGGFRSEYVYDDIEFIRRASRSGKFKVFRDIELKVSDRRFRKYGLLRMMTTYMLLSLFFVLGLFKQAEIVKYQFGGYKK